MTSIPDVYWHDGLVETVTLRANLGSSHVEVQVQLYDVESSRARSPVVDASR